MRKIFVLLPLLFLMAGCATKLTVGFYEVDNDITSELRQMDVKKGIKIGQIEDVEQFDEQCSMGISIGTQGHQTFGSYTARAFRDELKTAGLLDEELPQIVLNGKIDELNFSNGLGGGIWNMTLTLNSSNGKSMTVSKHYHFDNSTFDRLQGCNMVTDAFIQTLQEIIYDTVTSDQFLAMLE